MRARSLKYTALLLMLSLAALPFSGCLATSPPNMDWALPSGDGSSTASDKATEIQKVLSDYGKALVDKDRDLLASLLDPGSPDFVRSQLELLDRLQAVPFSQYEVELVSLTETGPGTVIAKVDTAYTLSESFTGLPQPDRAALSLIKRENNWKIAGDATKQALGKERGAQLWDLGPVSVLIGNHVIVLYHTGQEATARQVMEEGDDTYPRLEQTLPGTSLPKVPVKIFDTKEQIDQAFPGQWQEWTGGASRSLGDGPDQGGEIVIESDLYQNTNRSNPGYNRKMIAHEMTHVALFPQQGSQTPPFLVEGLADYVGGEEPVLLLKDKLRRGEHFSPTLSDLYHPGSFSSLLTEESAELAYEEADTAVTYLENKYGNGSTLALLRQFKHRELDKINQDRLVDEVFRSVLGVGWKDFEAGWKQYVTEGTF